jgi:SAM-dependent methyltransferase
MSRLSEDPATPSHPLVAARRLIAGGTHWPSADAGPLRRFARRLVLRLMRPYSAHQEMVDSRLLEAIWDLDRRLRDQEALQLDLLTEDLAQALESLRAEVEAGADVVAGSHAVPYTAGGVLEQFREPIAGTVLGYRERGSTTDGLYRGFEDVFRGPEDRVLERQRAFLEVLEGKEPVLDAGCGRGEFLDLLRERGVSYFGVDADEGMIERCRAKGHQVELATASEYLEGLPEQSLGAVFSAQVIEHMPYPDLTRFLRTSFTRLESGGLFVAETVNPHAPHALKTFWVDPTHQHPLFPEVLLALCRLTGFASAYVFHPLGTGHVEDDRFRESEYAVVARRA